MNHPQFAPDDQLRLFFAVPLAEELHAPASEVQGRLRRTGGKIKWVERHNLHYTLKYLGDTPASALEGLSLIARSVARLHKPFDLSIANVGVFPRRGDIRVIWIGCRGGAEEFRTLAFDLSEALAEAKLAEREKRPFGPHLTLGRNKGQGQPEKLVEAIAAEQTASIGTMRVDEFLLLHSELRSTGPIYTEVARFELTG